MNCSDKNTCYYGKSDALPVKHLLRAGELGVVYENGCLRYITASGQELIRNIYSAVRDRNWGTVLPVISAENIQQREDEFLINYSARYINSEIDFVADYQITGKKNSISFLMKGKAQRSFMKNRIGFCVLHPLEGVKGKPCKITHPGNKSSQGIFPEMISPVSPATNIVAMEWENDTANCRIDFEGDVWEMEDHRNWTDSSYKTYCTPLALPFPAEIYEGTEIVQKVIFSTFPKTKAKSINRELNQLIVEDKAYLLPDIGTSLNGIFFTSHEGQLLKSAGFKHMRHDLKFKLENWPEMLDVAVRNSEKLKIPLELVFHFTSSPKIDLELLQKYLQMQIVNVKMISIVNDSTRHTNNKLISEVIDLLHVIFPRIPVGGGTDAYFAELNRNHFDASQLDFITYAVCPQVHAFDNDSLVENIAAQADTVESAKHIYHGKKVHISPITLKQRFNVVATGEEPPVPDNQLPTQVDERQMSLFTAGWTLGSLASLIKAGANAVTYYEAVGWRGIIQGMEEPCKPALFAGRKGDIYPVYHLLRFIHKVNPKLVKLCQSSHPLRFSGIVIESETEAVLLLANHTIEEMLIEIPGMKLQVYKELSAENMSEAANDEKIPEFGEWEKIGEDKIKIKPYSVLLLQL